MVQRTSERDWQQDAILEHPLVWVRPSNGILAPMRDASCGSPPLPEHHWDLTPSIDASQPDLAASYEADEEDRRCVLGGQRALGLHAPTELLVQPFDHVCGLERLSLDLEELEERKQIPRPLQEKGTSGSRQFKNLVLSSAPKRVESFSV